MENLYVGITDTNWINYIKNLYQKNILNEYINFWTPGAKNFKALKSGELFLFKLHTNAKKNEHGEIVGGGYFYAYEQMSSIDAWNRFGNGNGTSSLDEMKKTINKYKEKNDMPINDKIGCIILYNIFFFETTIDSPNDWTNSIVSGKKYEVSQGIGKDLKDFALVSQVKGSNQFIHELELESFSLPLNEATNKINEKVQFNQIDINDDISELKIYQIINSCFGKNYKSWMKAWYDINDAYGAWFPKISESNTKPSGTYGGTKNYTNTLSSDGTIIIEHKHDSLPDDDPIDERYEKKRFVFGRINDVFRFLGVFEKVPHTGAIHCEHKFVRIADHVNLTDLSFINSSNRLLSDEEISSCDNILNITGKEKLALTKIRVNQGKIRENALKKYCKKCALCGVEVPDLLIASHIKSWADSSPAEKGDINNILLLCPNHDALFDKHLISFDEVGNIVISNELDNFNRIMMNVIEDMHIDVNDGMEKYLKYHRDHLK